MRGWLIVGSMATGMPQERFVGNFNDQIPDASSFTHGDWILWYPIKGTWFTLVCVEVPL